MKKIDRLVWTAGFTLTSYGVRVGVRTNNKDVLESLVEYLPPVWKPSAATAVDRLYSLIVGGEGQRAGIRRFNLLYADAERIARSVELDEVLDVFEGNLHHHIAEMAHRRVFIHAGVVGWKGQAILIPGRSFSGKTSLVAELVKAGATYYSDEYAVLDSSGKVHPFSRPLAIREGDGPRQTKYRVEELGGHAGHKPLPVGLVVVSQYKAGGKWRPRQLSAGQGALALLDNTVSIRRQPGFAFDVVQPLASNAAFLKSDRGESGEVVKYILERAS
jgi:hypothetical protein